MSCLDLLPRLRRLSSLGSGHLRDDWSLLFIYPSYHYMLLQKYNKAYGVQFVWAYLGFLNVGNQFRQRLLPAQLLYDPHHTDDSST